MKTLWLLLTLCLCSLIASAQTNRPARLAIVSETPDTSNAVDLLTAEFSKTANLQLLERNEIDRIYREQGLSGGNGDYVKLGKLLGADGLLLFKAEDDGSIQSLNVRLVAVKQGAVLATERFPWPITDLTGWPTGCVRNLAPLITKLSLKAGEAIPISVVNLRSAVSSQAAKETETQLKLLTIERLSRELKFFVLERQRLELLANEKDLNADASEFWKGSYLLEGVVDQNGYSPETITIDARLTPSKGGAPISMKISGSRKNLGEVVNQLTAKISEALKINTGATTWNSAEEAKQYFDEATWALKWKVYREAQSAADSAWALGKQDLECALLRVRSYVAELPEHVGNYDPLAMNRPPTANRFTPPINRTTAPATGQRMSQEEVSERHKEGFLFLMRAMNNQSMRSKPLDYPDKVPDAGSLDKAIYILEIYETFSRNSPDGIPAILYQDGLSNWHDSDWYKMGLDSLEVASKILQHYSFHPELQKQESAKLMELQASARSVDKLIRETPSIRETYFVEGRLTEYFKLEKELHENPNIFRSEVKWGCYWQEHPQETLNLYRELISSPAFCYLHKDFWLRPAELPRLIAWNDQDREQLNALWNNFAKDLDGSTNVLDHLESKLLKFSETHERKEAKQAFTELFDAYFANRDFLMTNPVDVIYNQWGVGEIIDYSTQIDWDTKSIFYHNYRQQMEEMHNEYLNGTVTKLRVLALLPSQKTFLMGKKPFQAGELWKYFPTQGRDYSKEQALEILPLIEYYKSNQLALAEHGSQTDKWKAGANVDSVEFFLGKNVRQIINPEPPKPQVQPPTAATLPSPAPAVVQKTNAPAVLPEIITNILSVKKFLEIPTGNLSSNEISAIRINAHHWVEDKLLLDFHFDATEYPLNRKALFARTHNPYYCGIAIFDPATEHWEILSYPEGDMSNPTTLYHYSTLFHGEVFTSNYGKIRKYNRKTKHWEILSVSQDDNFQLFNMNEHLYAAKSDVIFEITDDGNSSHILASSRRQPSASLLDNQELGLPYLFEGPGHTLRVCTKNKIYTWMGTDWREDFDLPPDTQSVQTFNNGIVFHQSTPAKNASGIFILSNETNTPFLGLWRKIPASSHHMSSFGLEVNQAPDPKPHWKMEIPPFIAAIKGSDLFSMEYHGDVPGLAAQNEVVKSKNSLEGNYNITLSWLLYDLGEPLKIGLNFEAPGAAVPLPTYDSSTGSGHPAWMMFTPHFVFFGMEAPNQLHPSFSGTVNHSKRTGVWALPISELEAVAAAPRKMHNEKLAAMEAALAAERQNILTKYDLNHNGIIDPAELEEALSDKTFIKSQLDLIDTNHNSSLDARELKYFDANTNKFLEEKELTGIEIAEELLAERTMNQYDTNRDGLLDRAEFTAFMDVNHPPNKVVVPGMPTPFPDYNRDKFVDLEELSTFLKENTRSQLLVYADEPTQILVRDDPTRQELNSKAMLKHLVECYWQNPVATNAIQRFHRLMRLGAARETVPGTNNQATEAGTTTNKP